MSNLIQTYRRLSKGWALTGSAIISGVVAAVSGIAAGIAATYTYDRADSKGDDIAVLAGGLLAVGGFAFTISFSWLQKVHHPISLRTPLLGFFAGLLLSVLTTIFLWPGYSLEHYKRFIMIDWIGILVLGLAGVALSRYLFIRGID